MWGYFNVEFKQFFRNKKNLAIFALLTFAAIFYALRLAPAYDPIEKVNYDEIEATYLTRQAFIESVNDQDLWQSHPSVAYAHNIYSFINPIDLQRMEALEAGDLRTYAQKTSEWYFHTNMFTYRNEYFAYNARYYMTNDNFAEEDAFYSYLDQYKRYEGYAKGDYELTLAVFEQRTALQTLERLLKGPLPYIFLIATLLLTVDIVTKDRRHPSILKGLPIADWKRLFVKAMVALVGSIALWLPLVVGGVMIGLQFGFGRFSFPSPVYNPELMTGFQEKFIDMTLGMFLVRSFLLLAAWMFVMISIVLLFSIIFRQEMVNMLVGVLLVFGERFYTSRGVGFFWDVENYPTSYVQVGNVVSKYQNFYFANAGLHDMLGLKLLLASAAIALVCTLLISLSKRFRLIK